MGLIEIICGGIVVVWWIPPFRDVWFAHSTLSVWITTIDYL